MFLEIATFILFLKIAEFVYFHIAIAINTKLSCTIVKDGIKKLIIFQQNNRFICHSKLSVLCSLFLSSQIDLNMKLSLMLCKTMHQVVQ